MKAWEEMTAREKAEYTYKDIQKKRERRRKGEREADSFIYENILKAKKERNKIRNKTYRGK